MSSLDILPVDVRRYEIYMRLGPATRVIVRHALLGPLAPLPVFTGKLLMDLCRNDSENGHIIIEYLHGKHLIDSAVCEYAAATGNLRIMEWADSEGYALRNTCTVAAQYRHLHVLKWAYPRGGTWDEQALYKLADGPPCGATPSNTSVEMMNWFFIRGTYLSTPGKRAQFATLVGRAGDLSLLKAFWDRDLLQSYLVFCTHAAASAGHLHILDWIFSRPSAISFNDLVCNILIGGSKGGHISVFEWIDGIYRYNILYTPDMLDICSEHIVENGHLPLLKWLLERVPTDVAITLKRELSGKAAMCGHHEMAAWLRTNDGST